MGTFLISFLFASIRNSVRQSCCFCVIRLSIAHLLLRSKAHVVPPHCPRLCCDCVAQGSEVSITTAITSSSRVVTVRFESRQRREPFHTYHHRIRFVVTIVVELKSFLKDFLRYLIKKLETPFSLSLCWLRHIGYLTSLTKRE